MWDDGPPGTCCARINKCFLCCVRPSQSYALLGLAGSDVVGNRTEDSHVDGGYEPAATIADLLVQDRELDPHSIKTKKHLADTTSLDFKDM